jgi:phospholipid/cholesterol/gamma-HCH transport system substrate-binding protein
MESKPHALAAGIFVLAVTALLIGLAMWLLRDTSNTVTYEMATADAVTGLQPQAPVRFKGVAVGKVTGISFDPDQRGNVRVRIAVSPAAPVTQATFATLAFQGVTGLSFVQLDDPGGSTELPLPGPGDGPPRIPLKASALGMLPDRVGVLLDKVGQATDNLNRLLSNENQVALTTALKDIGATAQAMNRLAAHTDQTLGRTDLPALAQQATSTLHVLEDVGVKAGAAMNDVGAAAADLRRGVGALTAEGGAIDRLGDSAATLSSTTLPHIQSLTEDASRTLRRIDRTASGIDENPQSLLYGNGPIPLGPGEK